MQLIYRGHIYDYTPAQPRPYIKPRALNWRYRLAGESYEAAIASASTPYVQPRAINWRYQQNLAMS